jgi:hypothetical protein
MVKRSFKAWPNVLDCRDAAEVLRQSILQCLLFGAFAFRLLAARSGLLTEAKIVALGQQPTFDIRTCGKKLDPSRPRHKPCLAI